MTIEDVQAKIRHLEIRFEALKKSSKECLEKLRVPLNNVADSLSSLPADDANQHKQFSKDNLIELFQAPDYSQQFICMNPHWNYQNYQLLDHLIQEFDLEGVKYELKTYKEDLQQFRKKTELKVFSQSQEQLIKLPPHFHEVVAEFHCPDYITLNVVEEFQHEYANYYNLQKHAMMLAGVLPSSIITWFIPDSIVENLKMNPPETILKMHSVTKLEVAGYCVYPKVLKKVRILCWITQLMIIIHGLPRCLMQLPHPLVILVLQQ